MSTKKLIKALGLIIVVALLAAALPLQAKAQTGGNTLYVADWSDPVTLANVTGRETVLFDGTNYHMWYSSSDEKTLYHTSSENPASFVAGTAVTFPSENAPFEVGSVSVVYESNTFYMIAYGANNKVFAIYTSSNGNAWTFGGVVFDGTGITNLQKIDGPYLIKIGGTYRLYFQLGTGTDYASRTYDIYVAESTSITGPYTLRTDPVLTNGAAGAWDGGDVMQPWVVEDNGVFYMWYSGWGTGFNQQVGMAKSDDGYTWVKSPGNPIFVPATGYAEPSVITDGETWQMWTMGTGGTINYLEATGPFEFQSIQAAIDAANPGDTINVAAGEYEENLVINKSLNLIGAGDDLVTVKGVAPTTDAGMVNIVASNVTIDGFKFVAEGYKTIRLNAPSTGVTFSNNTVVGASYNGVPAGGWILFESNYNNAHSNLTITGNVFENNGGQIGVYLNPQITGLTFTNNIFRGDPTSGPVLGIDGMNGTEVITGNSFAGITSPYALFEGFGDFSIVDIFNANTWPAGYFPIGRMVKIPDTKLLMDPPTFTTTDTCTGTHEVYVKVQAVTNLVAYDLDLIYDSSLITVTNVENVGIVGGTPAPGNSFADGVINFGWSVYDGAGNPPTYNGDLNLIKITFQSKGLAGTGGFTIQPTSILVDWPDVFAIPYEITGGATVNFGAIVTNITAEPDKAYCDLAVAVAEANANDTLRVDANITTIDSITIDKVLTLDTNGKTITRTGTGMVGNNFFVVNPGGNLTINGGGTITTTLNTAIRIIGNGITPAKVKLENATVYGPYFSVAVTGNEKYVGHDTPYPAIFEMTGGATNETVFVSGNGAELIVSGGTLTGAAPIMGNGTVSEATNVNRGGTKITIGGETTVVDGNTNLAIYHPQDGLLTINGGTITGTNGIEMKAGDLIVTGGTILGTGPLAEPTATGSGSTDTGDAILIFNRDGYTGELNVNISGSPTITSTNAYALREFTLPGETSRLGVAAISGGHFTGGAGAVSFTTVSDTNLDLTGGDYNTDPIAYVYASYGTYKYTDNRWYIALLPVISSTDFDDPVNLGVQSTFNLTINPSVPGAFNMVFTGYPSETEIVYLGVTYTCVMSGDPAICTITVPVMLTGQSQSLPFAITVATAPSETPAASYPVTATLHAPAPDYGTTGRDLASLSVTVPVASGFAVTGTFTMQGNLNRGGIPVTLTWTGTGWTYAASANTVDELVNNFQVTVTYGGGYLITTNQPRYLNLTAASAKSINVDGPKTLNALMLRGGDVVDNEEIDVNDASLIGTWYGQSITTDPDANFDGKVNILDLALVGGNFGLTSATAYTSWSPVTLP